MLFRSNGLRLLLVGYESGSQRVLDNARKGVDLETARRFTRDCRTLGIAVHGTFILGLPGETRATIRETTRFACSLDVDTIQVALAAPYPGTELYRQARSNGWFRDGGLIRDDGTQDCTLEYPDLPAEEISRALGRMYSRFYFRPRPLARMLMSVARDPQERRRRFREGREFLRFLWGRSPGRAAWG